MLSVIIPAFNEEDNVLNVAGRIKEVLNDNKISFEIIFIDDGSADGTWAVINGLKDKNIRGIRFSRNFGKEGAIFAGLGAAKGNCVLVIDCDLQHPPELIPRMYGFWREGYEVVEAKKQSRGRESFFYKLCSKLFYKIMESSSNIDVKRASDFKLLDRKAVDALLRLPERLTFFRALSSWIGFKTIEIEFEVAPRTSGKTKWNYKKLISFAISNLTSFSNVPMQFITFAGIIFLIFAFILGSYTIVEFVQGKSLAGYPTTVLLILIVGSFLMIGLGVIGYYISKIYEEIKFRPRFIIKEEVGESDVEE
ncbi:MAG: glycosyltransferase family 2 protein [Eubacterium sp.]|nr:glycosyltransferase family 2 protein [Eubacterium sp.]